MRAALRTVPAPSAMHPRGAGACRTPCVQRRLQPSGFAPARLDRFENRACMRDPFHDSEGMLASSGQRASLYVGWCVFRSTFMDVIGAVGRLNTLSEDVLVRWVDALLQGQFGVVSRSAQPVSMPLYRRLLATWVFLYLGSLVLYYLFASIDYFLVFVAFRKATVGTKYRANWREIWREVRMSTWSLAVMSLLTTPIELLVQLGYTRVYDDPRKHGILYFILSPVLFLVFSDTLIYFIHRGLHHRRVYRFLHKPHHSFIDTTPFSAFAFHPLDGFAQGFPYQLFVLIFPFHSLLHLISLAVVGLWTINIHDRVSLSIPGVNGAAHHRIHHTTFRSNYGQYFTFWDRVFGTHKDPKQWHAIRFREEDVYGAAAGKGYLQSKCVVANEVSVEAAK
jgi:lathosterol oxidase